VTETRTIRSYGSDHVIIEGLTRGPANGWTWTGADLRHTGIGVTLTFTAAATAQVAAAIAAYVPGRSETLTATQFAALPADQRDGYELVATRPEGVDEYDDEHVWRYRRSTWPVPGECEIAVTEITMKRT
jgi:hypothetical protein